MTNSEQFLYFLEPIYFMDKWRYVTWTLAWSTLIWLIIRRFFTVPSLNMPSIVLWCMLILSGAILVVSLFVWIIIIPKGHQGLSLVAGVISTLPILIPAIASVFLYPIAK